MSTTTTNSKGSSANAVTGAARFIVPVVGELQMDASATLVTVDQLSVSIAYDDKYEISLSEADSNTLMSSIVLSGTGATFAATLSSPSTPLQTLIKKILDDSVKFGEGGKKLPVELADQMKARFQEYFNNDLSNILEDVHLSYDVKTADGASNMIGKLDDAACEVIAQQIPKAHYAAWSDASENFQSSHLPLLDGDEIVFVFDIASELKVERVEQKTDGANVDTGANVSNAGGGKYTTSSAGTATYVYEARKIAFFVTVTGGTAAAAAAVAAAAAGSGSA